jgi:hypothetical protein
MHQVQTVQNDDPLEVFRTCQQIAVCILAIVPCFIRQRRGCRTTLCLVSCIASMLSVQRFAYTYNAQRTPETVHMSCFGVSADAVSTVRHGQMSVLHTETWSQRLAATKTQFDQASRTVQSRLDAGAQATSTSSHASSKRASAPVIAAQGPNLHPDAYRAIVAASLAKVPVPRASAQCSSLSLGISKLQAGGVPASTDFQAIADSSVGGGGLPRPYGRFVAARCGDGTALWERLPPGRTPERSYRSSELPGKGREV